MRSDNSIDKKKKPQNHLKKTTLVLNDKIRKENN
jgi:hypothetical protein